MALSLNGQVAVVTGAGGGLGREHALLLARQGAKVVVNDLGSEDDGNASPAQKVVAEIVSAGGEAVASHNSVATADGAQAIIQQAIESFGRVDILVNNAGVLRDKSFLKMDLADFEFVLHVHLFGATYCAHAAWPHMMAQKYGRIINTTSVAGLNGNFGQANYAAAKMGIVGLTQALAIEGRKSNVLVNVISPAAQTRMTEGLNPEHMVKYLGPDLVSPLVGYLASQDCSTTGEIYWVGTGGFAKMLYFEAEGVQFDPAAPITTEMVAAEIDRIRDMSNPLPTSLGTFGRFEERLRSVGRWEAPDA